MIDHVRGKGYIQRKENRWLLVKDLDREMETLFIDLLVILYSYKTTKGRILRGHLQEVP